MPLYPEMQRVFIVSIKREVTATNDEIHFNLKFSRDEDSRWFPTISSGVYQLENGMPHIDYYVTKILSFIHQHGFKPAEGPDSVKDWWKTPGFYVWTAPFPAVAAPLPAVAAPLPSSESAEEGGASAKRARN